MSQLRLQQYFLALSCQFKASCVQTGGVCTAIFSQSDYVDLLLMWKGPAPHCEKENRGNTANPF